MRAMRNSGAGAGRHLLPWIAFHRFAPHHATFLPIAARPSLECERMGPARLGGGSWTLCGHRSVVLWQNAHVAVLFDLSYILNTATRIAQGQAPYRDFPLAHAPLTFLIQAAIIRLTGRVFFHHVLYVALWRIGDGAYVAIALATLRGRVAAAWTVALLVAAPLTVVGIYCIVPNPEYDCDCAFWILVAVWLLQKLDTKASAAFGFAAGAFIACRCFQAEYGSAVSCGGHRRGFGGACDGVASARQTPAAAHNLLTLLSAVAGAGAHSWLRCSRCIGQRASAITCTGPSPTRASDAFRD